MISRSICSRLMIVCLFISAIKPSRLDAMDDQRFPLKVQPHLQEIHSTRSRDVTRRSLVFKTLRRRNPQGQRVQKAAAALTAETKQVNKDLSIIENSKSSTNAIRNAAKDALKQEKAEDGNRSVLAKAGIKNGQGATVRAAEKAVSANGPSKVVDGFAKIKKNPGSKSNVAASIKEINQGRVFVKKANQQLIQAGTKSSNQRGGGGNGSRGGNKRGR